MSVAQESPRSWTPHIILFSLVFHAILIYALAVAFRIVPPPVTTSEPPTIQTIRYNPKPPELKPEEEIVQHPKTIPREPKLPPVVPTVEPLPIPAQQPAESTADRNVIAVNNPIPEQPVAQPLPTYPRVAMEREVEGRVVLSITIMPDGSVRDVRVVSANPRGYFEEAALRSVRNWRYRPSNAVRTNVIVHMDFVLKA